MIVSWQRRRSDFNHSWLKNQYMNRLNGCIERLKIEGSDFSRIVRFVTEDFPKWEGKRDTARQLICAFESEMSPQVLFERDPLGGYDRETKAWLGDLIYALWLVRVPVKKWICEAEKALISVDRQYTALKKALDLLDQPDPEKLIFLLPNFIMFRQTCEGLSQAISQFPHEVLVV